MYQKYRIFIQTTRGGYFAASGDSVNGLAASVKQWLDGTGVGRSIYDETVQRVIIMRLDEVHGNYQQLNSLPANSRRDIIRKVRSLGGR